MPDMAITQCRDCNKVTFAFRNATHRHATQVHQSFFTAPDKWQLFSGISHWWLWTPASTERTLPVLQARNTWISFSFTALHYSLFIKLISNLFQVSWTSISTRGAGVDWDNPSENWDYGLKKPGYRANAMTLHLPLIKAISGVTQFISSECISWYSDSWTHCPSWLDNIP